MDLPFELVRDILELAAAASVAHNQHWVSQLSLVCKVARAWVQPVLFHTLCIDLRNQQPFFALLRAKPPEFFSVVRHLFITWALPPGELSSKFLASFQHVRVVSVHFRYLQFLSRAPAFRPTKVFVTSAFFVDIAQGMHDDPAVLRTVTHLRLHSQAINQTGWPALKSVMPALTHVCLDVTSGLLDQQMVAFKADLAAFLEHAQCARITVRYNVRAVDNWALMFATLRSLNDPRVYAQRVKRGERVLDGVASWLEFCAIDARAGIDAWNCGRPVCTAVTRLAANTS